MSYTISSVFRQSGIVFAMHKAAHTSFLGPPILKRRVLGASRLEAGSGVSGCWLLPLTPLFFCEYLVPALRVST